MKNFIALAALAALTQTGFALGCTCMERPSPLKELEDSSAVFSGVVTKMELDLAADPFSQSKVTFVADRIWKGARARAQVVHTALHEASCGYPFRVGEKYLVYAFADKQGRLRTTLCDRTTPARKAADDVIEIGPGVEPGRGGNF